MGGSFARILPSIMNLCRLSLEKELHANDLGHRCPATSMSDDTWSAEEAMSKLAEALKDKGMTVDDMFATFDADSDGTINGPELHHGIRDMVGDILSPAQISVIIQALDVDADHRIGLDELRNALSEEE